MRGLIYKEISIFLLSIDKKLILIAAIAIVLLMRSTGIYAGLFATVMFSMTIGMQNITSFTLDEKTSWKKYQSAMPVSNLCVITGKYISVLCTVLISLLGSLLFNTLSRVLFGDLSSFVWELSIAVSLIIPIVWTAICLPLTYWFGFRCAQTMGLFVVIPLFYLVKYFEDGPGFPAMVHSVHGYIALAFLASAILFGISMAISLAGYRRRK